MTGLLQQLRNQENGKRKQPNGEENEGSGAGCSSSDDEALQQKQLRGEDSAVNGTKMVSVSEKVAGTKTTAI